MRSLVSSQFRKQLEKLPGHIQEEARQGFQKWKENPQSVGWKRLNGPVSEMYSSQIGNRYRAIGIVSKEDGVVVWTFIGSHEDYNNYIKIHAGISQTAALRPHLHRIGPTKINAEEFAPSKSAFKNKNRQAVPSR